MKLTLKQWLLGGALLLTVAAVLYVRGNDDDEKVMPVVKDQALTRHKPVVKVKSPVIEVEKLKRRVMPEDVKDMFAAKSWYVPPPPPPPGPAARPVAPPLPFVYVGKMIESDGKAHVFLSRQDRIYSVSEGGILDGNYSVDAVKGSLMTLTYLPLHEQQTLKIGESN